MRPKWTSNPDAFELPMVVLPEDIDGQGIASNIAVLAWMNRVAIAHSSAVGWTVARYRQEGAWFVVRRHEIDYLGSARLGDRLLLRSWVGFMKAASSHRHHEILRPSDGTLIARGMNHWAWVSAETGRPQRMPPELIDAFRP